MLTPISLDRPSASAAGSPEQALAEAVDRIAERLRRGERFDLESEIARNTQCAESLRMLLPTLEALALAGRPTPDDASTAEISPNAPVEAPRSNRLGDFELVREVGRGGMGIVYEARQISLARRVAIKVLPAASLLDERQLQRFQNEARAAAQLNQSHIVDVLCVGCDEGVHYFAMRFIEGGTLAEVIAQASGTRQCAGNSGVSEEVRVEGGQCKMQNANCKIQNDATKIQHRQAAEWIAQAAEALDHAHAAGIVHRDVKPSNLLIDGDGKLWVTDFGVARFGADAGLTLTGDLLGTLRYMSPEQALGRLSAVGPRSDVYSLGATLYELLAARPVFAGDDRGEVLRQVAFERPMPLRTLAPIA